MNESSTRLFCIRVRRKLEAQGLNQPALAAKSGVSQPTISRLLSGSSKTIEDENAGRIASALGETLQKMIAHGVAIEKPHRVKEILKKDGRKLIASVGKLAINAMTGQFENSAETAKEIWDHLSGLEPPGLGWVLVQRAMLAAAGDLIGEAATQHPTLVEDDAADGLQAAVDEELAKAEIVLDEKFFEHPLGGFDQAMADRLAQHLAAKGVPAADADALAKRLPAYFVYSLQTEFRNNLEKYRKLLDSTATPLDGAVERQQSLAMYRAWLDRELDLPLFGEKFSLRQVFVPLRCWYQPPKETKSDDAKAPVKGPKPVGAWLHRVLAKWLEDLWRNYNYANATRFVTGGPGSGKSSSLKTFAAEAAKRDPSLRVLFVPLHRFTLGHTLPASLDEFCQDHEPRLPAGILTDETAGRSILIFDGLDELSRAGAVGVRAACELVETVLKWLDLHRSRQVAVVFAGRPIAVDQAAVREAAPQHVLHLLPYCIEKDRYQIDDPDLDRDFDSDQRCEWWSHFGKAKGQDFSTYPKELAARDSTLRSLTEQPLLNYLIAISYLSGRIDFNKEVDLNEIYDDLLGELYERRWGSGRFGVAKHLGEDDFKNLLEDVALAAWHGPGRSVTEEKVLEYLAPSDREKLRLISSQDRPDVTGLFVSFFIHRKQTESGPRSFEFTHKTFGEYLAARRIVKQVIAIHSGWEARRRDSRALGYDDGDALVEWAKLFGPTALDHDIARFIRRELPQQILKLYLSNRSAAKTDVREEMLAKATEHQTRLASFLVELIRKVLDSGMPMDRVPGLRAFQEMNVQSIHAESALLVIHASCGPTTVDARRRSTMQWPDTRSAYRWLMRFVAQPSDVPALSLLPLIGVDLGSQSFSLIDFNRAKLERANLEGATLVGASLAGASLAGANLRRASLEGARLLSASLGGANLEGARLRGANLEVARLRGANLRGANLIGARLVGSRLSEANLKGANLLGANLEGAYLIGANVGEANLEGANLLGANLEGANLEGANLEGANLDGAKITVAQLKSTRGTPRILPYGSPGSQKP